MDLTFLAAGGSVTRETMSGKFGFSDAPSVAEGFEQVMKTLRPAAAVTPQPIQMPEASAEVEGEEEPLCEEEIEADACNEVKEEDATDVVSQPDAEPSFDQAVQVVPSPMPGLAFSGLGERGTEANEIPLLQKPVHLPVSATAVQAIVSPEVMSKANVTSNVLAGASDLTAQSPKPAFSDAQLSGDSVAAQIAKPPSLQDVPEGAKSAMKQGDFALQPGQTQARILPQLSGAAEGDGPATDSPPIAAEGQEPEGRITLSAEPLRGLHRFGSEIATRPVAASAQSDAVTEAVASAQGKVQETAQMAVPQTFDTENTQETKWVAKKPSGESAVGSMTAPPDGVAISQEEPSELVEPPLSSADAGAVPKIESGTGLQPSSAQQAEQRHPPGPTRQILHHLSEIPLGSGDRIEVTLSPDELGRVHLSARHTEQGVILLVQAERAETLDLMRRHLPDLMQDLRDMGFGDVSYSDGRPEQQQHGQPGSHPDTQIARVDAIPQFASTGLDLRL